MPTRRQLEHWYRELGEAQRELGFLLSAPVLAVGWERDAIRRINATLADLRRTLRGIGLKRGWDITGGSEDA